MIELYDYQKRYLADLPKRVIMSAELGTGKTFMALAHYKAHGNGQPLLIVAPASKVRTKDWEREITEFFGEGNEPQYEIYSYEKFSRTPSLEQFAKGQRAIWHRFAPNKYGGEQWAVIADEVHYAKAPQSGRGQALFWATRSADFFVGLSATPLPNGWIDFANYSKIWGFTKGITEFKRRYCDIVDFKGFPEIRGYWREKELKQQWQSISKRLTREEALELPARQFVGVNFKRPPEYFKMFLERIDPKTGEELDNPSKLAHALRQTLTKGKLAHLSELLESTDENIIIFYNYETERDAIVELIAKKHKDKTLFEQNGHKHEIPSKADWDSIHNSITLAHYKSGGTGVEMTYATVTIYFSPTYSYAEYAQSLGRNYRNGQDKKVMVYNYRTLDTIEVDVYQCLGEKREFSAKQWEKVLTKDNK